MSEITVENLLGQIRLLPAGEKRRLCRLLIDQLRAEERQEDGAKFVAPIPLPDPEPAMRWMNEHSPEYAGEWVALDGDRLIAHGKDSKSVFAAARADSSTYPFVTFIPPADLPFVGI